MEAEPVSLYAGEGKRHYKKDSRFVLDLYTLTYDEHESVDTVELFTSIVNNTAGNWVTQVMLCTRYSEKKHKNQIHVYIKREKHNKR